MAAVSGGGHQLLKTVTARLMRSDRLGGVPANAPKSCSHGALSRRLSRHSSAPHRSAGTVSAA